MRKKTPIKDLKKLFALSGNRCAFPDCPNHLVNEDGNLIAQVCHIEAAEEGGERFNPKMTDDERASFDNLIIFCATHHLTTNDVQKYSVNVLKTLKQKHEARFSKDKYQPTEAVIEQAQKQILNQKNSNSGSGTQNNYQAGSMVVNNGMTVTEVVTIVQTLYDANFPKLVAVAKEEASKNIAKFESEFKTELSKKLVPEQLAKFSDPDIQTTLYSAVQSSARKDNVTLRKMLSNLVIQRVAHDENELKQKVLNEAVNTVPKLTSSHLKILTLCFLIRHTTQRWPSSWENFKILLSLTLQPFVDVRASDAEIMHLQYAGCGKVEEVFSFGLADHWRNTYSYLFQEPYSEDDVNSLALPEDIKQEIVVEIVGKGTVIHKPNKGELKSYLEEKQVDEHLIERVIGIYEQKLMKPEQVKELMESELSWMKNVFRIIEKTKLNNLTLTPVGMAIAISYYESVVGGTSLDLDIWVN